MANHSSNSKQTSAPYIIGLTGGIASGKSLVSHFLEQSGIEIIDADLIGREIVHPHTPIWQKIVEHFEKKYKDSSLLNADLSLNRAQLRQIIFEHPIERQWLESVMHPEIKNIIQYRIRQSHNATICLVIPLLKSREDYPMIQTLLVMDTDPAVQLERLIKRDEISIEQAKKIIQSQPSNPTRLAMADIIISNHDTSQTLIHHLKTVIMPQLHPQEGKKQNHEKK